MLEYLRLAYENTENMCEMRREGRGQWTATTQDRVISPTAPKVLVTDLNHIRWSYSLTVAFKKFISVPSIWICLLLKYVRYLGQARSF
jgi:hypothetical protein